MACECEYGDRSGVPWNGARGASALCFAGGDTQDGSLNLAVGAIGVGLGGIGGRAAGTLLRMGSRGFLVQGAMGL